MVELVGFIVVAVKIVLAVVAVVVVLRVEIVVVVLLVVVLRVAVEIVIIQDDGNCCAVPLFSKVDKNSFFHMI